jgi:hypothetical protein
MKNTNNEDEIKFVLGQGYIKWIVNLVIAWLWCTLKLFPQIPDAVLRALKAQLDLGLS